MASVARPDCRRFVCDLCSQVVYICSWCDRGHRYCSPRCREKARQRSLREAGRRYQQSLRGRHHHARRQALYRQRQRAAAKKVTHHGCQPPPPTATVSACSTPSPPPPADSVAQRPSPAARYFPCALCGARCAPWVREDFVHCRRPARSFRSVRGVGGDQRPSRGRDPAPV